MKIVHVPWTYFPDPVGGTEIYVAALIRALQSRGVTSIVAAPNDSDCSYEHSGIAVRRFGRSITDLHEQYGVGDRKAASGFARILDDEQPDLVHLHAYSSAVSKALLCEIQLRGLPTVFTYHTPAVSCLRGDLLQWGKDVCDGELHVERCTGCSLNGRGLPRPVARLAAKTPTRIGGLLANTPLASPVVTALRMTDLVDIHHRALATFLSQVGHVVVPCEWARRLLVVNGVRPERISFSRHGIDPHLLGRRQVERPRSGAALRIVYIGRIDPVKGLDVVIKAIRREPNLPVQQAVHGVVQADSGRQYLLQLRGLAGEDPRITFFPPVPAAHVVEVPGGYDAVIVPSRCLETGPLVVLEAFAAGVSVVGSNLGGISELVRADLDGILIDPPNQHGAWLRGLRHLIEHPDALEHLRNGIRPPRTTADVAADMQQIYTKLTKTPLPAETAVAG